MEKTTILKTRVVVESYKIFSKFFNSYVSLFFGFGNFLI